MKTFKNNSIGVLLVNLGTPDGTGYCDMRRYLREFLSDRRVIEWPRLIWLPILHLIVLSLRPRKSGRAYERIWNFEKNESPLRTYTRNQATKLAEMLSHDLLAHDLLDAKIDVDWAMRYGQPSIDQVTNAMIERGCQRILIFPLYPQYSATTTATVLDVFFDSLKKNRFIPAIRVVPPYAEDPAYIDALASSIRNHLKTLDFIPDVILASYHGIPQSYVQRGDPYFSECQQTITALRHKLGMNEDQLRMTFQSRFGPEEWLQPYTDKTLEQLGHEGVASVAVFNPGFVSDCLETIDEIAHEAAEIFHDAGGKHFTHIPCLNDSPEGMKLIEHLVRRELSGWLEPLH